MNPCYKLVVGVPGQIQTESQESFIGGKPKIPKSEAIPTCGLCGVQESFFFQVTFPADNPWANLSIAVFACTSCSNSDYVIPKMLDVALLGANIPAGFLEKYQINFRFMVFQTSQGVMCNSYNERVIYKPISLVPSSDPDIDDNKIGGNPVWMLDDESPGTYAEGINMVFLLQLLEDQLLGDPKFRFHITPNAPRQMGIALDQSPKVSSNDYYELFIGNKIFVFGTYDPNVHLPYIITQI